MEDKIVVITGASEGLGRCVAKKLAAADAILALVANEEDTLIQTTSEIGENAHPYVCDISSSEQVQQTTHKILEDLGRVTILINNAGLWTDEEIEKAHPEKRREVFEVNALGAIEFTKALEPHFREQNSGHILNVISAAGTSDTNSGDNTSWQTYGASKWALAGFTRALGDSLRETGVKVTGFYPGAFESNLYERAGRPDPHNQPWMMRTEDVADALIFCLTRPADVVVEKLVVTRFSKE